MITIRVLAPAELPGFGRQLAALERDITYPLGDDRFRIDHGPDYFRFFARMGRLRYLAALREEAIVGGLAAIERHLPDPVLYVGDLKVAPDGRGLGRRLAAALATLAEGSPVYGISMNPGDGAPNRVVGMLTRAFPALSRAADLSFYTLDTTTMRDFQPVLESHRGPSGFLSLRGIKDIVLASTGAPMELWHTQFGPTGDIQRTEPVPGGAHMFCTPTGDGLDRAAQDQGLSPSASATIVSNRMTDQDWGFVLTSEI